jgi:putative tryptophan/tyrosine transport system substrate-binding protein
MRRRALLQLGLIGACYAGYTAPVPAQFASGSRTRRRIAVLITLAADDGEAQRRLNAFREGLRQAGWVEGDNIELDIRWGASDAERSRQHAAALAADAPDAILATGSAALGPLLNATRTVPIVFVHVPDPVGAGFVDTLARPGGNATGFGQFEYSLSGKWVELLREIAPTVTRAGVE